MWELKIYKDGKCVLCYCSGDKSEVFDLLRLVLNDKYYDTYRYKYEILKHTTVNKVM